MESNVNENTMELPIDIVHFVYEHLVVIMNGIRLEYWRGNWNRRRKQQTFASVEGG